MNKNKHVLGIVAEYNPFHNGHQFHLEKSKEIAKADYTIAVISGNFTQRGEISIINKFEKAKMAINNGIDMVIELPTIYSTSSAENFANGAVKILNELNIVTHISFGIETENIEKLKDIANILLKEPEEFSKTIKEELKKGNSYPSARKNALVKYAKNDVYGEIISSSNNILAIEYLKSLQKIKSNIIPIGIKRKNVDYNSKEIVNNYASGTKIREILKEGHNLSQVNDILKLCIPKDSFKILQENIEKGDYIKDIKCFEDMIFYKLRSMNLNQIQELPDVNEGLENTIKRASNETNDIDNFIDMCKSKRYTRTRIQRIIVYSLLGITKKDMEISKRINPYARILGINEKGKELLSIINKNKYLVTSLKKFENFNSNDDDYIDDNENNHYNYNDYNYDNDNDNDNDNVFLKRMLEIDKYATDIYSIKQKTENQAGLDYKMPLIL